LLKTPGGH